MPAFATDIHLAVRALLKSRGFTATTLLTLALGITFCTTAVVVMKGYLLQNLPYPAADRLYTVRYGAPGEPVPRGMEAIDWTSAADVIEQPIAWDLDAFYLLGGGQAETIPGAWVTPGFVEGLGIRPALGRGFDAASFAPGSPNVALISHGLWTGRFAADPHIVGRTFSAYVSDRPEEAERFTIIGVLPPDFWHLNSYTDIFAPLRAPTYPYMVRLRPGVTPEDAASRITALVTTGVSGLPPRWRASLVSSHEAYVQAVRPMLRAVTVAAAVVMLVACANVAGLLLIRATRRRKEIAVRAALGAGRGAIARMLLAEGLIFGTAGTALALLATRLALGWLAPLVQLQLGRRAPGGPAAFTVDAATMAFAAGLGLATALLCTLVPLLTARRPGLQAALQSDGRTATEGRRSRRLRSALIAFEIAASLALLTGTSLMLRSVVGMLQVDLGFDARRVILASVTLRQSRYPDGTARLAVFDRIQSRLSGIAGAESVGLTTAWPVQQPRLQPIAATTPPDTAAARAAVHAVGGAYFPTLGIPLAAGRLFDRTDARGSEPVALVSESLARRLWPAGQAVGSRLTVPLEQEQGDPVPVSHRVVGIVRDVRQGPEDSDPADVYVPLAQTPGRFAFVLMRTSGHPSGWLAPLRAAFHDVDPEIPVARAALLQDRVDDLVAGRSFLASLFAAFAVFAALLALVGVYGVIAYAVQQRTREIAVRMALGADPARLTRLFVRQGAAILAGGLALGVLGALAAGRLIESQLYGVTPRDPVALGAAVVAFAAAGLLAIWWPSRRAAATDPAIALRAE
jgi:predicted permease